MIKGLNKQSKMWEKISKKDLMNIEKYSEFKISSEMMADLLKEKQKPKAVKKILEDK